MRTPVFIFIIVYVSMYGFATWPTSDEETKLLQGLVSSYGVVAHFGSVIAFALGGFLATRIKFGQIQSASVYEIRERRLIGLVVGYCAASVVILVWQISVSIDMTAYWRRLGESVMFRTPDPNVRNFILLSHDEGGLSGALKMFSYLPLSALYVLLTYRLVAARMSCTDDSRSQTIFSLGLLTIIMAVLVRTALALDRGVLFYCLLIILYYRTLDGVSLKGDRGIARRAIIGVLVLVVVAVENSVSAVRQGTGLLGTLSKYCALGLANLSLLLNGHFEQTWGLSLFAVVGFPLRYFGLEWILPVVAEPDYVWNPAAYLTAYAYQDFGILYILFFVVYGYLATTIYGICRASGSAGGFVLLFPTIVTIIGSFSIPPFRGPEWWISTVMAILAVRVCFRRLPRVRGHRFKRVFDLRTLTTISVSRSADL